MHRGIEDGIQAGGVENGVRPSIEILDPGGMDTVDDGVGNGAVPLAELAQQRLGPATGFSLKLALKLPLSKPSTTPFSKTSLRKG